MQLARLVDVMAPPERPLETPQVEDWALCEREIAPLPSDYKSFLSTYGTGTIDEFLWIYNPTSSNKYLNLVSQHREILSALAVTASEFPTYYSMPLFPEPGGFLPFAVTDNGDSIFWVTIREPDAWTIAVMGPRSSEVFRFEGGTVAFLLAIIADGLRCDRFPSDFPSEGTVHFTPSLG